MIQRVLLRQSRIARSNVPRTFFFSSPQRLSISPRISTSIPQQTFTPRCYSTTSEPTTGTGKGETPNTEETSSENATEEDPQKKELEAKNREIIDLKDKYLRSVAEFRNLQDRTKREIQSAKDFAISRFAKDLIDSVDNLDRALSTVPADKLSPQDANKDLVNLHEGLTMTEAILMQTLQKHGLERFDPSEKGEKFDPNLHEATFQTPVEGKEDGVAFHTQQKGFRLNGRVLRAAKVGVVKNS